MSYKINQTDSKELSKDIEIIKISRLRKAIAKKMTFSKSVIPETTLMDEIDVSKLVILRKNMKLEAEKQGIKLTYMAFIAKAVNLALKEFPLFNSSFDENKDEIIIKKFINLGIAVDTKDGLIVPNVKNSQDLNIFSLAQEIKKVATDAITRKIQLNQIQNGTFTISNLGSIDISYGTPVINHPEVAILGVGKIIKKPIVVEDKIVIADVLPLSLTIDHRIIDGANGGMFLKSVKNFLHNPNLLI